jgi:hypothetical protein
MPKLVPVTHRELAQKLKRVSFQIIWTTTHPVWFCRENNLGISVSRHPGDVWKGAFMNFNS